MYAAQEENWETVKIHSQVMPHRSKTSLAIPSPSLPVPQDGAESKWKGYEDLEMVIMQISISNINTFFPNLETTLL